MIRDDVVVDAARDVFLERIPLDGIELCGGKCCAHAFVSHLRNRIAGAIDEGDSHRGFRLQQIVKEGLGPPGPLRAGDHGGDLGECDRTPSVHRSTSWRHGVDLTMPCQACRRCRVYPAAHVEVDATVHERTVQFEMIFGHDGSITKPPPRCALEQRLIIWAHLQEGVETAAQADVEDVEVFVSQNAALSR